MVGSLSELVSLKESAVLRARQRSKEANDEHVEVTREMRQQIADLQNSLAKYNSLVHYASTPFTLIALIRLQGAKVKEQLTPESSPGPTVTRLLTQVHTLEDELRVSNHSAAALAGQLRTLNGELQRWKDLADARHAKLQSLQDR
jgi:chromosome segregation ATPase